MQRIRKKIGFRALILGGVSMLALSLYLYKLGDIPNGLYVDEAVVGYNALSILKTGRDEYGKFFPVAFKFFGSYTPPLYVYLTSIFVKILGLSVFSVRLPSVLLGFLSVILIYKLMEILKLVKSKYFPLLVCSVYAFSPWQVFYTRIGYEIYLGYFLYYLAVYLFVVGVKRMKVLPWSGLAFSLAIYSTHSQRYLMPVTIVALVLLYKAEVFQSDSLTWIKNTSFVMFFTQIPNFFLLFTPAFFTKGNLFYKLTVLEQSAKIMLPRHVGLLLSFVREFGSQYFAYFSPRSLFFLPEPDLQRSVPELAPFYFWMVIPYFIGIYIIFRNIKNDSYKLLLMLVAMAPLPAAFVGDPFSTQRTLTLFLPVTIVICLGINHIFNNVNRLAVALSVVVLSLISCIFLWRGYFVLLPNERAKEWGYGFEQLSVIVGDNSNTEFLIDTARMKPAYIEFAFYLKYPPEMFHQDMNQAGHLYYSNTSFNDSYSFGNITTRSVKWEDDVYEEQIIVGDEYVVSESQAEEHCLTKEFADLKSRRQDNKARRLATTNIAMIPDLSIMILSKTGMDGTQ
jgi:hypothetical protein